MSLKNTIELPLMFRGKEVEIVKQDRATCDGCVAYRAGANACKELPPCSPGNDSIVIFKYVAEK